MLIPLTIDFVVSDNPKEDAKRLGTLRRCTDPKAQDSADAIFAAHNLGLVPGHYQAKKIGDWWEFTRRQQPSSPPEQYLSPPYDPLTSP